MALPCGTKKNITPATVGVAISRLTPLMAKGLLLTNYVTPNMADELREKGVQFLDAAGNAYLNEPLLFVFVKVNRPAVAIGMKKTRRAFRPTGLQVLFALLFQPELVTAPFREIANIAGAALGTVSWVMRDLKELGFIVDMGTQGRHLTRKAELIDRWVTAFPDLLRPKLVVGRFMAFDPKWHEKTENIGLF